MLQATNITYTIGSKVLLNHVSLHAKAGELLVIAGPNGAGKSTLLKLLSEKTNLDMGCVTINEKDIMHYTPKELAKIRAVLPQSFSANLPFQVEEVIMMGRYPHFDEYPNETDVHIVKEIIAALEIEHLRDRVYATLSGGEQQRVQLGRVLAQIRTEKEDVSETKYFFLDEPVSSLDLYHQQIVLQTAKYLTQEGYCVIAVLHDLNLISQYADNVLLMYQGHVEAYGSAAHVFTKERIKNVYGLDVHLIEDPVSGQLFIVPDTTLFNSKTNQIITNKPYDNNSSIPVNRTLESI
jgi:iron complex transport system ATP-binding protein